MPQCRPLLPLVLYHHEDYEGGGYPLGLHGDRIPLDARIIPAAETYVALSSPRPYRALYTVAKALEILASGVARQFDGCVVAALCACVRRERPWEEILDRWIELNGSEGDWRYAGAA